MSSFDDHSRNWNDDRSFTMRPPLGEILGSSNLSDEYGFTERPHDHDPDALASDNVKRSVNVKLPCYIVAAEAIGVGMILFFTFMP
jgi:hypothetical protein